MSEHRLPGQRLGRRKPDRSRPVLLMTDFLTGTLPAIPPVDDHLADVAEWNGRTNISFGTCGPCALANYTIMVWKYLLGTDITVSDAAIFDLYQRSGNPTFDPATGRGDGGVDMTVMLSAALAGGLEITLPGGVTQVVKPLAFASVPLQPNGLAYIKDVTALMGGVLFGLDLEISQQSQTSAGLWDYTPSPDWGGHATMGGKYVMPPGDHAADVTNITWQQPVGMTDPFIAHQDSECYAVIYQAHLEHPAFLTGVDVPTLASAYTSITGKVFPVPVPAPPPAPIPAPVPAPVTPPLPPGADPALAVADWSRTALPWTRERHYGLNKAMAQASKKLLLETGYIR
jgi:hypothetical protein